MLEEEVVYLFIYFFTSTFIQVKIRFNKCTISSTVTNTAINVFPVVKYEVDLVKRKRYIAPSSPPPKKKRKKEEIMNVHGKNGSTLLGHDAPATP